MSNAEKGKLVSPYLRQPLRTYAEAMADRQRRLAEEQAKAWLRRPAGNVVPLQRRRPIPPRLVVKRRQRRRPDAA